MARLVLFAFELCRTTLFTKRLRFYPQIVNESLLCFLWRLLPGASIGTLTDDIELHRTSVREIGEVASVRFAQEAK